MEKDLFIALAWEIKESSPNRQVVTHDEDFKTITFSGSPLGKAKLFFFDDTLYAGIMEYRGEGYDLNGEVVRQIY